MEVLWFELAMTAYLVATVLFVVHLSQPRKALARAAVACTVGGFMCHSAALTVAAVAMGGFPVTGSYEAASFFSWMLVLVYLGFEWRGGAQILGAFTVPLAFLSVLSAAFLRDRTTPVDPSLTGFGLALHTSLILAGGVAFCLAFLASVMYLVQMRLLKSKRFNTLYRRLPPLDACDALVGRGLLVGFPLMTLGLLSGAIGAKYVWGSYWDWSPRETVSALTWGFYLILLVGRSRFGFRAKRGAYLAIAGFLGVVLSFIGLDVFFGEVLH